MVQAATMVGLSIDSWLFVFRRQQTMGLDIDLEKVRLLQCVRILHVDYTAQVGKLACSAAVTVLDLGVV